jgi:activator of HSP90 ATPase
MKNTNDRKQPAAISRRRFMAGTTLAVAGLTADWSRAWGEATSEISRTSESIHQERDFAASPLRVYDALTLTAQFDHVVRMSAAMQSGAQLGTSPTAIHNQPGGVFTLFGGHISGRFVELVPHQRIVQAWRVANWDPGSYSIARYALSEQEGGTKLTFDHTAFPNGQADHLAAGWIGNYWEPLAKYLTERGPSGK